MHDDLRYRLDKHKGERMLPDVRRQLEHALGFAIAEADFLDLESSDRLLDQFSQKVKRERVSHLITWEPSRATDVWQALAAIASPVHDTRVAMFHPRANYTGVVMVPADATVRRAREVMESLRYDLNLCSLDLANGLCLQYNHYHDPIERNEFELTTWGRFLLDSSRQSRRKT